MASDGKLLIPVYSTDCIGEKRLRRRRVVLPIEDVLEKAFCLRHLCIFPIKAHQITAARSASCPHPWSGSQPSRTPQR